MNIPESIGFISFIIYVVVFAMQIPLDILLSKLKHFHIINDKLEEKIITIYWAIHMIAALLLIVTSMIIGHDGSGSGGTDVRYPRIEYEKPHEIRINRR
ncbi:hypothetical protein FACS1894125_7070 [Actinomycetota bacterium]|nr:hypothetical protein FACS1894125_7070 [Actinomycetota bacterium]